MKQKYLAVLFSALLVVGVLGIMAPQGAEAAASIGYVNVQRVLGTHPDMKSIQSTLEAEQQKAQKDFDSNTKNLSNDDKALYMQKLRQELAKKEQELMNPLQQKIFKAIEKVAKEKGVDTVVNAGIVIYGGQDLTEDVIAAAK